MKKLNCEPIIGPISKKFRKRFRDHETKRKEKYKNQKYLKARNTLDIAITVDITSTPKMDNSQINAIEKNTNATI